MSKIGRTALLPLTVLALVVLAGCSLDEAGASVACEQLIDQRVGAELVHRTVAEGGAVVEGEGPFVVRGAFAEPADGTTTAYVCTVERIEDGWRLMDLTTDR